MRLEQLWPGARSALIADYVPECATPDWTGVTFENVLNMTSGVYGDPGFEVDENSEANREFFNHDDHAGKIRFACTHFHRKAQPGTTWVYRTTDTYVLGTAMQAFARKQLGATADLYRDIHVAQLWHPLGLSPVIDSMLRTYDAVQQPFAGYGPHLSSRRHRAASQAFLSLSSGGTLGRAADARSGDILAPRPAARCGASRHADTAIHISAMSMACGAANVTVLSISAAPPRPGCRSCRASAAIRSSCCRMASSITTSATAKCGTGLRRLKEINKDQGRCALDVCRQTKSSGPRSKPHRACGASGIHAQQILGYCGALLLLLNLAAPTAGLIGIPGQLLPQEQAASCGAPPELRAIQSVGAASRSACRLRLRLRARSLEPVRRR